MPRRSVPARRSRPWCRPRSRRAAGGWHLARRVGLVAFSPSCPGWSCSSTSAGSTAARRRAAARLDGAMWRSRQAIALAAFFGIQSMQAYVQFGWAPQMFRDAGLSATYAGSPQRPDRRLRIPAGIVMPLVVARMRDLRPVMVALGAILSVGYLGILWAPTTVPWLWATCLGLSACAFPAALALMTARTRAPGITAKVSGFTQMVGYLFAAAGPSRWVPCCGPRAAGPCRWSCWRSAGRCSPWPAASPVGRTSSTTTSCEGLRFGVSRVG